MNSRPGVFGFSFIIISVSLIPVEFYGRREFICVYTTAYNSVTFSIPRVLIPWETAISGVTTLKIPISLCHLVRSRKNVLFHWHDGTHVHNHYGKII